MNRIRAQVSGLLPLLNMRVVGKSPVLNWMWECKSPGFSAPIAGGRTTCPSARVKGRSFGKLALARLLHAGDQEP
jgi:hypothetical protein